MSKRESTSVRVFGQSPRRVAGRARSGEEGYTMLFAVFLAATMLISLSVLALNIVTQGQREKEEEMVWRGHQYERGIRRYMQKFGKYPSRIDDMVKATNGVRYMRAAYKDPMNKEDGSWRFIYVTPNGALIGSVRYTSLVQMALYDKMMQMGGAAMAGMNGMGGMAGMSGLGGVQGMQGIQGVQGMQSMQGGASPFSNGSGFGGQSAVGGSSSGFGQPGNGMNAGGSPQNPGSGGVDASGNPISGPGQNTPGQNGGGAAGFGNSGFGNGTGPGGAQSGSAFGFSSPGGGFGQSSSDTLGQMSVLGGSITGVGSKIEKPSLKIYKGAKKYKEWEFIFNPIEQQQQAMSGGGGGVVGVPIGQPGQNGTGSSFGQPGNGMGGSPFSPTPTGPELPPSNPQPPSSQP